MSGYFSAPFAGGGRTKDASSHSPQSDAEPENDAMPADREDGQPDANAQSFSVQCISEEESDRALFLASMQGVSRRLKGRNPAVTGQEKDIPHILARLGMKGALDWPRTEKDRVAYADREWNNGINSSALDKLSRRLREKGEPAESDRDSIMFTRRLREEEGRGRRKRQEKTGTFSMIESGGEVLAAMGATMKSAESGRHRDKAHADSVPETVSEPGMQALLNPDEELDPSFVKAMRDVRPIKRSGRDVPRIVQTKDVAVPAAGMPDASQMEFMLHCTEEYIEGHVVGLDLVIMARLRQGMFSPEGNVDLHGLNIQQAFQTLTEFIKNAWFRGMRCVIVVPGRGKNSPGGVAVLREKVRMWLTQYPFKRVVLAFCTALPRDGGPGSIYVLLRKEKIRGSVCWDRTPSDPDLFDV